MLHVHNHVRLSRKSIGAKLVFKVGEDPLPGFRMIERHYFKDQLIKSFDFTLGFCMYAPQEHLSRAAGNAFSKLILLQAQLH